MADKENFSINFFFYLSPLLEGLRNLVHRSVDICLAKNSGYIHMTSQVDLFSLRSQVLDIVSNHPFYRKNFEYLPSPKLQFVQQIGYHYDYISSSDYLFNYTNV